MSTGESYLAGAITESTWSTDVPCLLWGGYTNDRGYGRRSFQGRTVGAHRVAWIMAHGEIPEGMTVDHRCYTPACVNVQHLRLLTRSENSALQRSAFKPECVHGHEYTPENTGRTGRGHRRCLECHRQEQREYVNRKRAAA